LLALVIKQYFHHFSWTYLNLLWISWLGALFYTSISLLHYLPLSIW